MKQKNHIFNEHNCQLDEIISILQTAEEKLSLLKMAEENVPLKLKDADDIERASYVCHMLSCGFNELETAIESLDRLRVRHNVTGKVFI